MNIHYNKQSQFELFPGVSQPSTEKTKTRFLLNELTLSWENLVVLTVFIVLSMVVSFSLGVEQGKKKFSAARDRRFAHRSVVERKRASNPPPREHEPRILQESPEGIPVMAAQVPIAGILETLTPDAPGKEKVAYTEKNDRIYTIQVASFRKEKYAQMEARELRKKGFEILVLPKGNHSIVCVGKFERRDDAQVFSRKLRGRYKDCLVRSL